MEPPLCVPSPIACCLNPIYQLRQRPDVKTKEPRVPEKLPKYIWFLLRRLGRGGGRVAIDSILPILIDLWCFFGLLRLRQSAVELNDRVFQKYGAYNAHIVSKLRISTTGFESGVCQYVQHARYHKCNENDKIAGYCAFAW